MDRRKHQKMLASFEKFTDRIGDLYDDVLEALTEEDYVKAQKILAHLAQTHARTSLSLRGMLIREGLLKEDGK